MQKGDPCLQVFDIIGLSLVKDALYQSGLQLGTRQSCPDFFNACRESSGALVRWDIDAYHWSPSVNHMYGLIKVLPSELHENPLTWAEYKPAPASSLESFHAQSCPYPPSPLRLTQPAAAGACISRLFSAMCFVRLRFSCQDEWCRSCKGHESNASNCCCDSMAMWKLRFKCIDCETPAGLANIDNTEWEIGS